MKIKTSITLAPELLQAIEQLHGPQANRSRIIEQALIEYLQRRRIAARERRDLEILNRHADELNREVREVLAYQVDL